MASKIWAIVRTKWGSEYTDVLISEHGSEKEAKEQAHIYGQNAPDRIYVVREQYPCKKYHV